jgi:hypothetical protein
MSNVVRRAVSPTLPDESVGEPPESEIRVRICESAAAQTTGVEVSDRRAQEHAGHRGSWRE